MDINNKYKYSNGFYMQPAFKHVNMLMMKG